MTSLQTPAHQASPAKVWTGMTVLYLVWGSTYLAIAVAVETMPPLVSMGARFFAAALVLLTVLMIRMGPAVMTITRRQLASVALISVLLLGFGIGNVTLAEQHVPSGVVALLVSAMPLWVVLLRTATGDRPALVTWIGIVIGLAGVATLVAPGRVAGLAGSSPATVTMWSLIVMGGSMCWAFGSFISPRLDLPRNPLVLTTYEMFIGGAVLMAAGFARGEQVESLSTYSTRSWLGWLYLMIIGSLLAYTTFVWILDHAPLSLISTYAYVNPVVAVLLGHWIKAEPFSLGLLVGGAIVVSGVVLVVSGERLTRPHKDGPGGGDREGTSDAVASDDGARVATSRD